MMQRYEPKPWDIRRCDMVRADDGGYVLYDDARAEIERLTKERDEARAQVAAAYEAAAKTCSMVSTNYLGKGADTDLGSRSRAICDVAFRIRALAPADAQSALEAYGREKVREGMQRAATIAGQKSAVLPHYPDITRGYAQGRSGARDAILADMETLK